jgi:predicted NBD/HSP70 family sugar kinase
MIDKVVGVITDLATEVIAECEIALSDTRPETVVNVAVDAVERLLIKANADLTRLSGIGVALPGLIDAENGICRLLHRFGWKDVPVAALLAERLSVPVWVDNDANAFAIAQHLFGYGLNAHNVAAVAIGRGVGAGLVIDGKLYRGTNGGAGEFGHNLSEPNGRACECGRVGCLEAYCSEPSIVRTWQERGGGADAESLADAAAQGDLVAREVLREAGLRLGRHVSAIANLIDPEVIIIGGEAVRFGSYLFDPVRECLDELSFAGAPPLVIDWQDNAWARGASALAIQHFFNFEVTGGHEKLQRAV